MQTVYTSVIGALNKDGSPARGDDQVFSTDDPRLVNKKATIALHAAMDKWNCRKLKNLGLSVRPLKRDELEKRALADIEWQRDEDKGDEQKNLEGAYLYGEEEDFCKVREVDPEQLRKVERHVAELYTRAAVDNQHVKPYQRQMALRALDGSVDTALVGVDYLNNFLRDIRLAGRLVPLIGKNIDIPAGSASHKYSIIGDLQFLLQAALTTNAFTVNTAVNPTSSQLTLTPKKIQAVCFTSGELTEDSLAPIMPALQESGVRGANVALDHMILNGDTLTTTANINARGSSADALGSKDPRLAFDGLRAKNFKGTYAGSAADAFGGVDGASGTSDLDDVLSNLALLGKWADDPMQTVTVMPSKVEKTMLKDVKARPDTYSGLVEIAGGKLKTVGGSRIVTLGNSIIDDKSSAGVPTYATFLSEGYPVNLNASGVYDDSTTTQTGFTTFAPSNCVLGWKRMLGMKVVDLPLGDQQAITMSLRVTLEIIIDNEGISVAFNFDS